MKRSLSIALLMLVPLIVSAQTTIIGTVRDAAAPVAYATISVQHGQTVEKAVAANEKGEFSIQGIKAGTYTVEASMVGYAPFTKEITVADKGEIDLGEITLREGVAVEAVAVTIQKPIVTADAEKISYSIEDDPESNSSTLEEMIRKVPQLSIDADGNVLMNGQSNYKILVNGHESKGISSNFKEVIKSMPASSIQKIEVITNPSMKYDAEGSGGILNIILAKSKFEGYNGSINLGGRTGFDKNWMTNNSARFSVEKNKFALTAQVFYSQGDFQDDASSDNSILENLAPGQSYRYMLSVSPEGNKYNERGGFDNVYGDINASYQIDTANLVTMELSAWSGKYRQSTDMDRIYSNNIDGSDPIQRYLDSGNQCSRWLGLDATVNYEHSFSRPGHTLTLSDNLSYSPPVDGTTNGTITDIVGTLGYSDYSYLSTVNGITNTIQVDYNNPLTKKHSIEAGAKHQYDYSYSVSDNTLGTDPTHGTSDLSKNILGMYFGYGYKGTKTSVRMGARVEGAWYALKNSIDDDRQKYDSSLWNFVPYVSFTYTPKMGHSLALSYTERLSRPGIEAMSPYVQETPTTRTYGNPDLESGVSHSFNCRYMTYANKWNLMVGYTGIYSSNQIAQYSFMDAEGIVNTTYTNAAHLQSHMMEAAVSYRPIPRISFMASVAATWQRWTLDEMYTESSGWGLNHSATLSLKLWKGAQFTVTEMLFRIGPTLNMTSDSNIFVLTMQLGQKFLKDKLEVQLKVTNPQSRYSTADIVTTTPSYRNIYHVERLNRMLGLSVTYKFGKSNVQTKTVSRKDDSTSYIGTGREQNSGGGIGL